MRALLVALSAGPAAGCIVEYHNDATTPIQICIRHNGEAPGQAGGQLIPAGTVWKHPCVQNEPYQSWQTYFSKRNLTGCGCDACDPNTCSCKSYPWQLGTGISADNASQWFGGLGANFDPADWAGGAYTDPDISYGVKIACSSYGGTAAVDETCGVTGSGSAPAPCVPNNVPQAGGQPNTGVIECDATTIKVTIFDDPPRGPPTPPPAPTPPTPPPAPTPPASHKVCVHNPSATNSSIQGAIEYACNPSGGGVDCAAVNKDGACYDPNTLAAHADWIFNTYYQANPVATSCDFGGAATLVKCETLSTSCVPCPP